MPFPVQPYTQSGMVRWKLKDLLDGNDITRYRLSKESGVAMNTIRDLYAGQTMRPDLEVMNRVLNALTQLLGRPVTFDDLLEHVEDAE